MAYDFTADDLFEMADTQVFFEKEMGISSMKAILKAAILAEKDAIVFYLGMKDLVPDTLGKDKLDKSLKKRWAISGF